MMSFLLFIIVLIINYNSGSARTIVDSDLQIVSRNGWNSDKINSDQGKRILKLPTVIEQGTIITLNGILETNNKTFTVILRGDDETNESCKLILDFQKETINVTPGITELDTTSYNLNLQAEAKSKFSLRVIARLSNGTERKEMLALSIHVNEEGESSQLICDVKSFENITVIEMREGVARINNLLFEFKENR